MKNILIILLLAGLPLWAQTPAFAPLPPDPAPASRGTNANNQQLQEMLRRTLVGGTNAPAGAGLTSSSNAAAANVIVPGLPPEAVAPAGRGTNRSQRIRAAHRSATNAVPVGAVGQPVKAAAGAGLPALPAAMPVPQPSTGPAGAGLNAPTGSISPVAGMPAAPAPPPGAVPSAAPGMTGAPAEEMLPQGMIDFRAADLNQVLDIYSDMVKRTVLRPATLPAPTITLTTKGQLTMREGIQALEAVLALNGITMVNMGDKFVKALPEAQGNTAGARFDTNNAVNLPELGQYVTHVVQLKYARPSEMTTVLQPFIKIPNAVLPIDSAQILVLRDYTENIKRMLELIERIDVAVPSEFVSEVIPIKYAKASEIASALNSLSSGGGGTTVGASSTGTSRTSRMTGMNRTSGTTGTYPGQTTTSGMVTPPGSAAGTPTAAGSSFSQRLQNIINRASQQGEIQVLGQTKIISDERTNSLLIYAAKEDMKTVKDIVAKLDVVLAQVLIEAVIMSVTLTDSRDLGISYLQRQQTSGKWSGVGAINNKNMFDSSSFNLGTSNGLPQGFSYLTSWGSDLDVVVTALAANSQARILQRPRIQTSHNEAATLFVGQSRPYPTSSYYGGGAYGGYSSIQQLQIGVTLEVTPLINPDGLVVMDIHTKIESYDGDVAIDNVGNVPITSSKEAVAKVSVRDHDTIILGGLIQTDRSKSASGVPLLMDIPVLGHLFRSSSDSGSRSELIVLIRPTVLPTPEIAALAAVSEKNKMPGVRQAEKDFRKEEIKQLKKIDKADPIAAPNQQ